MKYISFDVGIKNLAYCIFDVSNGSPLPAISISDWNVISLLEPIIENMACTCIIPPKTKKASEKTCNKLARYQKHINGSLCYFCEKHAKKHTTLRIPEKQYSQPSLKKKKLEELVMACEKEGISIPPKTKKLDIVENLTRHFDDLSFLPIVIIKEKGAKDIDLISVGKKMKLLLNDISGIENITHVLIENQISPIATRMKTVQGMLAQYFIMKNSDVHIDFISSANKLKHFAPLPADSCDNSYKKHKIDGITYCSQLLKANPMLGSHWENIFSTHRKKDDLADCFLQGIWYLQHTKTITLAEELKIKIV